jgi:site-specific DNA-methyltransferase (adenine-specific)
MNEVLEHWMRGDDFTASGGGFMGKTWDSFVPGPATWKEVFRVLKPGGHVLMFSGTRTFDIATLALRLAGFEIRDCLSWMYGQGFPKSMDISKAIDKQAGAEREVVGPSRRHGGGSTDKFARDEWTKNNMATMGMVETAPATPEAKQWEGWGTALKPSWEPIVVARKPVVGTVAANVLKYGTGALNIDATRIATNDKLGGGAETETRADQKTNEGWTRPWMDDPDAQTAHAARVRENVAKAEVLGRFPANTLLTHTEDCVQTGTKTVRSNGHYPSARPGTTTITTDGHAGQEGLVESYTTGETVESWECAKDCPIRLLDAQTGVLKSGVPGFRGAGGEVNTSPAYGAESRKAGDSMTGFGDQGGASRFFYNGKVTKKERNLGLPEGMVNDHPTVKPVDVMEWLIKLITPPGGWVVDPFMGSGATAVAAAKLDVNFIGLELDPSYVEIAAHRAAHYGATPGRIVAGGDS